METFSVGMCGPGQQWGARITAPRGVCDSVAHCPPYRRRRRVCVFPCSGVRRQRGPLLPCVGQCGAAGVVGQRCAAEKVETRTINCYGPCPRGHRIGVACVASGRPCLCLTPVFVGFSLLNLQLLLRCFGCGMPVRGGV